MKSILSFILFISALNNITFAQTWYTGNPNKNGISTIEDGFLITKTPIEVLDPPSIHSIEVTWDKTIGIWKVTLTSKKTLKQIYKPCRFYLNGWNSYTVRAGDLNGGSFLMIAAKSYEHSIEIRDAIAKQMNLKDENITTEPQEAEQILK